MQLETIIKRQINALYRRHGPQGWWPRIWIKRRSGRKTFEVAVGAILTQNTVWTNVEKALACLAKKRLVTPKAIARSRLASLASCVKSSGYYRQKAKKLKIMARFFLSCPPLAKGRIKEGLAPGFDWITREKLLALWGVGKETADTILLYGLNRPVFVVDAYTRRWLVSLTGQKKWLKADYDQIRKIFEKVFSDREGLQEAHALIVKWGKLQKR